MPVRVRSNGQSLDDFVREAAIFRSKANDLAEVESAYYKPDSNSGFPPDDIILNGLVLNLPLYKLTGSKFKSVDAYHHTATNSGSVWGLQGRSCDGTDDQVSAGNATSLRITGVITLEGWAKWDTISSSPAWVVCRSGTIWAGVGYGIFADNAGVGNRLASHFSNNVNDWNQITISSSLVLGQWIHLAATYDGVSISYLYKNGVQIGTTTYAIQMVADASPITIGSNAQYYLDGTIGEVRIYNRALSAVEIVHNYNATRWRYK